MQVWDRHRDLGRFDWRECALEMARDAPVGKHAKCGRFRLQLRQHELRILEIGNRAAEGLAFAGIVDGPLYRRLAYADAADRLRQTLLRQFGHERLETFAFAPEAIGDGHTHSSAERRVGTAGVSTCRSRW